MLALAAALAALAVPAPAPTAKEQAMGRLDYVELPAGDVAATRDFYEAAFGWTMTEFAPTYAATTTGDTDVGLDGDAADRPEAPLPVIQVKDLERSLEAVKAAGGVIVKPITPFPGGRRFHFRDPSGNELGVWQKTAE